MKRSIIQVFLSSFDAWTRAMIFYVASGAWVKFKNMKLQQREEILKKKPRHTVRQLPQTLAGILIKTKLVSLSEQTWQALSRGVFLFFLFFLVFFSILAKTLSECRCCRNVFKGGGIAELTFSLLCCESACVYFHMVLCTHQFFLAPFWSITKAETWS